MLYSLRFMYSCIAILPCVRINDDDDDDIIIIIIIIIYCYCVTP